MKRLYIVLFFASLLMNCSDENHTLDPSYRDIDWFRIEDSSDEIDKMRHEIYRSTGISIFYSDTIGRQFRGLDGYGDSIVHHEILTPDYTIAGSTGTITFFISYNRKDIKNGVLFLKEYVIPELAPVVYPRSYLLTKALTLNATSTDANGRREGNVYNGLMTTIVSGIGRLETMSTTDKKSLACEIAGENWLTYLNNHHSEELEDYYTISNRSVEYPVESDYKYAYDRTSLSTGSSTYLPYRDHWYKYGFLTSNPDKPGNLVGGPLVYTKFQTPTMAQDVASFVGATLFYSEQEFENLYGPVEGYEFLIEKFRMMKKILDSIK